MIHTFLVAAFFLSAIVTVLPWLPGRHVDMGWTLIGGFVCGACFWMLVVFR